MSRCGSDNTPSLDSTVERMEEGGKTDEEDDSDGRAVKRAPSVPPL